LEYVLSLFFFDLFLRDVPVAHVRSALYRNKSRTANEEALDPISVAHERRENEVVELVLASYSLRRKEANGEAIKFDRDDVVRRLRSLRSDFLSELSENDYRMSEKHKRKEVEKLARVHGFVGKEGDKPLFDSLFSYATSIPNSVISSYWLSDVESWDYEYYDVVTSSYDVGINIFFFFLY
jgi:hypothetical protein